MTISPDFPQALLATVAVRATLILAAAWLLTQALRGAAAATRHVIWTIALTSLILLPVVSVVLPRWDIQKSGTAASATMPMADAGDESSPLVRSAPAGHEHAAVSRAAAASRRGPMFPALVAVLAWVLGAVFGVGRLSAGWAAARRLIGRARPAGGDARTAVRELAARLGIRRDVRVLVSESLSVPVNCGLFRPAILLPAAADAWSAERLRVVLLHELAHVRRWDYASLLAMETARAMYWMNPLVWLAARRANVELERACDDEVLGAGTRSVEYAEHLYEIAASLAGGRAPRGALAMAQPSTLRDRVGAILAGRMNRSPLGLRAIAGASVMALMIGLPLTSLRLLGEGRDAAQERSEISALTLADARSRVGAAYALGMRRSSRATAPLIARMNDADPGVRGMAAWALGTIGERDASPALAAALGDSATYVREMAVLALGTLGDPGAIAALAPLVKDSQMGVRGVLTSALRQIGGERAGTLLGEMLLHDGDDHVRDMAAWNLQMTAGADAVPWLVQALRDPEPAIRTAAARTLAKIGAAGSLDELANAALHDRVPMVRGAASWALGSLRDVRATDALVAAMRDSVWHVRVAAANALADTPGPRAAQALIAATRDPVHQVRLTAVEALDTRARM